MSKINENQPAFTSLSKRAGNWYFSYVLPWQKHLSFVWQGSHTNPPFKLCSPLAAQWQAAQRQICVWFCSSWFLIFFFPFPAALGKGGMMERHSALAWGMLQLLLRLGSKDLPWDFLRLRVFWGVHTDWVRFGFTYQDIGTFAEEFFFVVIVGISQEDPFLVWKTGWEAWNECSRAPGGWQSGQVPWLGGESSQGTWGGVRGFHLCKGCPEVSLNSLFGQMSSLDWSLKDLGVPKVCCALQCFLLEGFGGKKFNLFLSPGNFLHCTCVGWKQVRGGKFVWMRGWRKGDETSWLRLQRPCLNHFKPRTW